MSLAPIFSFLLKGNLKDKKLVLQYPINKLQKGIWQIAIDSLCYKIKDTDDQKEYICSLKCNWITDVNFNQYNELITESPFIFQFALTKKQSCISSSNKTWFEINCLSEFLICEVFDLIENSVLSIDCSCYILFHVQRKI